jgi:hypothetical protein
VSFQLTNRKSYGRAPTLDAPKRHFGPTGGMAKRLKRHGLKETEPSITNKLARGTFQATFFLACLAALELDGVALEEI